MHPPTVTGYLTCGFGGVDSYLPTLDSQSALYSGQQSLITLKQAEPANLITLYKALGGGWNEHTVLIGVPN